MKIQILVCFFTLAFFAEEYATTTKLQNGVIVGLGGNYSSVKIDQQIMGHVFSSVDFDSSLVALGETPESTHFNHSSHSILAPQVQLGYIHRFSNQSWFLGCKAAYQYLGITFTENNLDCFEAGKYMAVGSDIWVGHFFISSCQTHVDHELSFIPIFGYFFNNSAAYLGAGPVIFGMRNDLYGMAGMARVNGTASDVTGSLANLSFSQWVWGGVAQLGWIYPFTSSWFLDLSYSYAVTGHAYTRDTVLFSHLIITKMIYDEEGAAFVKTKQRVTAQSFTVSLNRAF